MKLYTIETEYFKLDGGAMFGVVPKSMWNKLNPADENNLCSWAMRCLLIEEGNKLILIDNGCGNKQDAKFFGHYFLHGNNTLDSSLKKNGFCKDDITDVVLTHLHFDHCGGSIDRVNDQLVPAFKNATYWSNEKHWEWAVHPNERERASFLKENILPIMESGQLQFVKQNSLQTRIEDPSEPLSTSTSSFSENISFRFVNGHTDMMMLPQINYNGKTIVFMADLLPSVYHIPLPYIMGYDMFPLTTLFEKKSFLKEALANNYTLFFEHDPVNECCSLLQTDRGIRQNDTFRINEL
jgi:glyoxylase-like metal-dependent hydrolase (beta-lactamase superfamily II)